MIFFFSPLCRICHLHAHHRRIFFRRIIFSHQRFFSQDSSSPNQTNEQNVLKNKSSQKIDMSAFPPSLIRNFAIIAHVDHGKSTLADRLLSATDSVSDLDLKSTPQFLDKLQVERERGITVKAQSVAMFYDYDHNNQDSDCDLNQDKERKRYLLNLVDTPGHVDFAFEVWRTMAACQGVILVVDANSGIQAQTVAHFNHALLNDLPIIPCINKIDLKGSNPELVKSQLRSMFEIHPDDVICISAKLNQGIDLILDAIINKIPPPPSDYNLELNQDKDREQEFKALLFDSYFDKFKGVVFMISIISGSLSTSSVITSLKTRSRLIVTSVGILTGQGEVAVQKLFRGQIGFFTANVRDTSTAIVGDLFTDRDLTQGQGQNSDQGQDMNILSESDARLLSLIPKSKPLVFAGIFPFDQSQTADLKRSLDKIHLTDPAVEITGDISPALGHGFRLGFLGLLHMEVFNQRLEQEFNAETVITAPSVPYRIKIKGAKNIKFYGSEIITITNPVKLPDVNIIECYYEPFVQSTIIVPDRYLSAVTALCMDRRGIQIRESTYLGSQSSSKSNSQSTNSLSSLIMSWRFPLSEIITDFVDSLKSATSGFASFDFDSQDHEYESSDLLRLDILINDLLVEELSSIVHVSRAKYLGNQIVNKLAVTLPQQQFAIKIQAAVGKKILSRTNIRSLKKDVTAKLYGGDVTRRNKLLQRQKEGKERMRQIGNVSIPRNVFIQILRTSDFDDN